MKLTTEELLLAARVRELVSTRLAQDAPPNMTAKEEQEWRSAQVPAYVKAAREELEFIAELLRRP